MSEIIDTYKTNGKTYSITYDVMNKIQSKLYDYSMVRWVSINTENKTVKYCVNVDNTKRVISRKIIDFLDNTMLGHKITQEVYEL